MAHFPRPHAQPGDQAGTPTGAAGAHPGAIPGIEDVNGVNDLTAASTAPAMAARLGPEDSVSRTLALLAGERELLRRIAAGAPLGAVLDDLVRQVEATAPGQVWAGILFLDADGRHLRHGAAPSLPPAYALAQDGLAIGPQAGSCGTAAHRGEAVHVADIANDPLWADYRDLALSHGFQACWSTPIRAADGRLLGTFSIYHPRPLSPTPADIESLTIVTQTVALAIERHLSDQVLREAEARHRQILNSATDYAIISLDVQGQVSSWNEGARRTLGWTEAEMLGQTVHRFFTPDDVAARRIEREMAVALAQGFASDESWRVRRDGSLFWASGQMTPLRNDAGEAIGFVKILRDRTRQRAADQRQSFLLDLSESLQGAEGAAQVTDIVAGKLGTLLGACRVGFGRLLETQRLQVAHDWTDGRVGSGAGEYPLSAFGPALAGHLARGELLVIDDVASDPRTRGASAFGPLQVRGALLAPLLDHGRLDALLFVNTEAPRRWTEDDVALVREVVGRMRIATDRALAREQLQASEERLRVAQRAGGIGSFELFPALGEIALSDEFCHLWGIPPRPRMALAELLALVHPDDLPLLATGHRSLSEGALDYIEYRIHRPDTGELRWMARRGEAVQDPVSGTRRYLGVSYDISDLKQAIGGLATSRESLQLATEAAEVGTWDLDLASGVLDWSDRTRAMFGVPPGQPCSMDDFYRGLHPEDRESTALAFNSALDPQQRAVYDVEYRTVDPQDGRLRWVAAKGKGLFDTAGRCVRAVGTAIDISARKAAEARQALLLQTAERLRPLGSPQAIVAEAVSLLRPHLGASRVGYARVDAAERLLLEADSSQGVAPLSGSLPLDVFGQATLARLRQGATAAWPDASAEPAQAGAPLADLQVRGLLAVPLLRDNRLRSVLYVHQDQPRAWSPEELGLVEEIAWLTWDAAERARAEEALRDESRVLETLNQIGTVLAGDFELDTLVQRVVDAGLALTGARHGAFFNITTLADGSQRMSLYALAGAQLSDFASFGMPRATAVFGPSFINSEVVRSADITQDPRYGGNHPHRGMPAGHLPVRSYLAVPVVSRSELVIGVLIFGHPEPDMFGDRSERVMRGLAAQAAIAIDNARLFQAVQKANEQLEARVEERTRERDQWWALSDDLLVTTSARGELLRVSPSWVRLLGHDEATLRSRPITALAHPDDLRLLASAVRRMRRSSRAVRAEARVRAADGSWRWIAWTLTPEPGGQRLIGSGRDVTADRERQARLEEAQEALRQSQKMEAVGQLTGGIAHDFNNLLQGITGSLDVVRRRVQQGRVDELERFITGAMNSAKRAAALTHRLLAFSRRQPLDPKPVRANPLVTSMEDLLRRTLGEGIRLKMGLAEDLWLTLCDPNQLESAILNLCINARDAMPDGGQLTVETCNAPVDGELAVSRDMAPGDYVCVCVTDTGVGMSPEVLAKAFDPFFTTKPLGQGTGLGLSMIYGFARQSEGYAKISSQPGEGTTVRLYLPRHLPRGGEEQEELAGPPAPPAERADAGQTVLVIEDEPVVRALIVEVLHELGYQALEADDGLVGLAILQGPQRIDLLVTDIGLPGLNGRQVVDAARQHRPGLKVLFMTGYAENAAMSGGFLEHGMQMVTKPFQMQVLAQRIRDMIQQPPLP